MKTPNHELSEMRCPVGLEDVDLFGPGAQEHWYEAYDLLHQHSPVHKLAGGGFVSGTDAFVLSKHEDIATVVRDPERFPPLLSLTLKQMMDKGVDLASQPFVNTMIASMATLRATPQLWRAHRQELTDPWIGPGAMRHEEMIRKTANDLIDRWIGKSEVDFVAEFAQPFPQTVMANVLGWPLEDLKLLKYFGDGTVKPFVYGRGHRNLLSKEETREQFAVLDEFKVYTQRLISQKRQAPQNDMISFLIEVEYSPLSRRLTDTEINGIVYAMVIGGLETTQYALAEQMQLLCEQSQVWHTLQQQPGKIRAFTEEGMRLRAPTQGLSTRTTSRAEVFQGVQVPAGSLLHMRWAAANIDPSEWECPLELQLDRKAGTRHLTFSAGPRVCPGATISRLEQVIAWETLVQRVAEFSYAKDNTFEHQPGIMLGVLALNLRFSTA